MATVISVLNQKGGAGKTTISTGVAAVLAELGFNVMLLDADPQGSSLQWSAVRQPDPKFSVLGMPHGSIHKEINQVSKGYDYVVIDGAPRVDTIARSAIMASDLVLIPVQPSPYDIWAAEDIVTLVKDAQIYKPMLKCAFVINRKISGTNLGREVNDALAKYELPILEQAIYQRVAYAEAAINGLTLAEAAPATPAAIDLMVATNELLKLMEDQNDQE